MRYIYMIYITPLLMIILFAIGSFNMTKAADDFGPRFGTASSAAFGDPGAPALMATSPDDVQSVYDDPSLDPASIADIEPAAGEEQSEPEPQEGEQNWKDVLKDRNNKDQ